MLLLHLLVVELLLLLHLLLLELLLLLHLLLLELRLLHLLFVQLREQQLVGYNMATNVSIEGWGHGRQTTPDAQELTKLGHLSLCVAHGNVQLSREKGDGKRLRVALAAEGGRPSRRARPHTCIQRRGSSAGSAQGE